MSTSSAGTLGVLSHNFMGDSPKWYKYGLMATLLFNFALYYSAGPYVTGLVMLVEFIATLALTLKGTPLVAGGILLLQMLLLGLVSPEAVDEEIRHNTPVLFLIIFIVTAVTLLKDLLTLLFVKAILAFRSELALAMFFTATPAVLSALLDALTVMSVVNLVLYQIAVLLTPLILEDDDAVVRDPVAKAAMRRIIMLACIGTMLGGIMTLVGEPQNILIGAVMGWDFKEFFLIMLPISVPVFISGMFTTWFVEKIKWCDYGTAVSTDVRNVLNNYAKAQLQKRTPADTAKLWMQGVAAVGLVIGLIAHVAEVYIVGLMLLIFVATFNGHKEHDVSHALTEGGGFVFILAIFFGVVAMINTQGLFDPVNAWLVTLHGKNQLLAYYSASGVLSAVSDNVFVASLTLKEATKLHQAGLLTLEQYQHAAAAINMGTNIPSIATPNGQAAFLFVLMAKIAKVIQLTYGRMFMMALPYTIICSTVGALAIYYLL